MTRSISRKSGTFTAILLLGASVASAQQTVKATATMRWDSRITDADTVAAWLSVTVTGIPEVAVPRLLMTDAFVTDTSGRSYRVLSVGYRVAPHTGPQPGARLASYTRPTKIGDPILVFQVRPGSTHYALRFPGMDPIPFDAWIMGHPRP